MLVRIKFSRLERVKFLGHLDVMRSFQRCFIRAGVKMVYSVGFNPHQKMNFAQPLGVGVVSRGDYLDAEIVDGQDLAEIKEALAANCGQGFEIHSVRQIKEGAEKGMAAVRYASYEIGLEDGIALSLDAYESAETVMAIKKTKSGEKEVDIKKLVHKLAIEGNTVHMLVSAGSENNLKPELLMQELFRLNGMEFDRMQITICRTDLYAEKFVSLEDYQTVES